MSNEVEVNEVEQRLAMASAIFDMVQDVLTDGFTSEKRTFAVLKIERMLALIESDAWRKSVLDMAKAMMGKTK